MIAQCEAHTERAIPFRKLNLFPAYGRRYPIVETSQGVIAALALHQRRTAAKWPMIASMAFVVEAPDRVLAALFLPSDPGEDRYTRLAVNVVEHSDWLAVAVAEGLIAFAARPICAARRLMAESVVFALSTEVKIALRAALPSP